jgi:hypothetical protein
VASPPSPPTATPADRVGTVAPTVTVTIPLAAAVQALQKVVLVEADDPAHAPEVDLAVEPYGPPPAVVVDDAQAPPNPDPVAPAPVHPRDLVDLDVDPASPVAVVEDVPGALEARLDRRARPPVPPDLRRGGTGLPEQQQREEREGRRHSGTARHADRHADLRPFGVPTR